MTSPMIPAEAIEAAADAMAPVVKKLEALILARAAVEAAAPHLRKPQQVTSRAHLNDLEDPDMILIDHLGNAYQWGIGMDGSEGWQSTRDPNPITSGHLLRFAPLTVLHVGTTK